MRRKVAYDGDNPFKVDVHPKKVQERLGHSTIAITMDTYSHVLPSMHLDVARKLGDLFEE